MASILCSIADCYKFICSLTLVFTVFSGSAQICFIVLVKGRKKKRKSKRERERERGSILKFFWERTTSWDDSPKINMHKNSEQSILLWNFLFSFFCFSHYYSLFLMSFMSSTKVTYTFAKVSFHSVVDLLDTLLSLIHALRVVSFSNKANISLILYA